MTRETAAIPAPEVKVKKTLHQCRVDAGDPLASDIGEAAMNAIVLIEPLVEVLMRERRKTNFAEAVRWRNKTMRELREVLGLGGNGLPLPIAPPSKRAPHTKGRTADG